MGRNLKDCTGFGQAFSSIRKVRGFCFRWERLGSCCAAFVSCGCVVLKGYCSEWVSLSACLLLTFCMFSFVPWTLYPTNLHFPCLLFWHVPPMQNACTYTMPATSRVHTHTHTHNTHTHCSCTVFSRQESSHRAGIKWTPNYSLLVHTNCSYLHMCSFNPLNALLLSALEGTFQCVYIQYVWLAVCCSFLYQTAYMQPSTSPAQREVAVMKVQLFAQFMQYKWHGYVMGTCTTRVLVSVRRSLLCM